METVLTKQRKTLQTSHIHQKKKVFTEIAHIKKNKIHEERVLTSFAHNLPLLKEIVDVRLV